MAAEGDHLAEGHSGQQESDPDAGQHTFDADIAAVGSVDHQQDHLHEIIILGGFGAQGGHQAAPELAWAFLVQGAQGGDTLDPRLHGDLHTTGRRWGRRYENAIVHELMRLHTCVHKQWDFHGKRDTEAMVKRPGGRD